METIENHFTCKILLTFLPKEIVHMISFKYGVLQHYYIKKSFKELEKHIIERKKFNGTITLLHIINYRMRNDISNMAFRFPDVTTPYVNKEAKICNVRSILERYSYIRGNYLVMYSYNNSNKYNSSEIIKMIQMYFGDYKEYNDIIEEVFQTFPSISSLVRYYYKLEPFDNFDDFKNKLEEDFNKKIIVK